MIAQTLAGSTTVAAASIPSLGKVGLVVVSSSMGLAVLVALSLASALGVYLFRKQSRLPAT
jgi:hypothetical protein